MTHLTFEQRVASFWSRVNKDGPVPPLHPEMSNCWIWEGASSDGKYGQFSVGDLDRRQAHNVAFLLENGRWPTIELDHLCHVTKCVRLEHLREVNRSQNIRNRAKRICVRGHALIEENFYYYAGGKRRRCKQCIGARKAEAKV